MENGRSSTDATGTAENESRDCMDSQEKKGSVELSHLEILLLLFNTMTAYAARTRDIRTAQWCGQQVQALLEDIGDDQVYALITRLQELHDGLCDNKIGTIERETEDDVSARVNSRDGLMSLLNELRSAGVKVEVIGMKSKSFM